MRAVECEGAHGNARGGQRSAGRGRTAGMGQDRSAGPGERAPDAVMATMGHSPGGGRVLPRTGTLACSHSILPPRGVWPPAPRMGRVANPGHGPLGLKAPGSYARIRIK